MIMNRRDVQGYRTANLLELKALVDEFLRSGYRLPRLEKLQRLSRLP